MATLPDNCEQLASLTEFSATPTATQIQQLARCLAQSRSDVDVFYIVWAAALIFFMQAGFATLSAGSIRQKNVKNILLKNLLDACIGALVWFLFGYGFAYNFAQTDAANGFIGSDANNFALSGYTAYSPVGQFLQDDGTYNLGISLAYWQFQFAFAAAAATIVSGAVAERCQLSAYAARRAGTRIDECV